MVKYKWFWITFGAWCFIGTVGAWAVIYSPFHLSSRQVFKFTAQVNGGVAENQILVSTAPMNLTLETLTKEWRDKGWKCVSGKLNLASVLLKIPKEYSEGVASLVQIRAFQNKDSYRLLGLLNHFDDNQTYQWIAEIPQKAMEPQHPSDVDFPLRPPPNATDIVVVKTKKIETLLWAQPIHRNPETEFMRMYTSQGFSGRLWSKQAGESVFLLQKGPVRFQAIVQEEVKKITISLVKVNNN